MPKEKKETIETKQKIILQPNGDNETDQRLIDNFLSHSDEEYRQMGEEIEEAERKQKEDEEKREKYKKLEAVQELKDCREARKQKISGIDADKKESIIKAINEIQVKIEKAGDGSRLIEFKLGNKIYKILDPKLKTHTDNEYIYNMKRNKSDEGDELVEWRGMRGYDIDQWKNQKLKEYVHEKMGKGLQVAGRGDIYLILQELGKLAGLSDKSDQIAMFMYLTGMDGEYYLKPGDKELRCCYAGRYVYPCGEHYNSYSKLFMISDSLE